MSESKSYEGFFILIHIYKRLFRVINATKKIFASFIRNYDVIKPWENLPHNGRKSSILIAKLQTENVH